MDWTSWVLGLLAGLIVALAGKAVDIWQRGRVREIEIATLVGELRAQGGSFNLRLQVLERRVHKQGERIDQASRKLDSIARHIGCDVDPDIRIIGGGLS